MTFLMTEPKQPMSRDILTQSRSKFAVVGHLGTPLHVAAIADPRFGLLSQSHRERSLCEARCPLSHSRRCNRDSRASRLKCKATFIGSFASLLQAAHVFGTRPPG